MRSVEFIVNKFPIGGIIGIPDVLECGITGMIPLVRITIVGPTIILLQGFIKPIFGAFFFLW